MKIEPTPLSGCFILTPQVYEDDRGYFFERFNQKTFENLAGRTINFVQDNESLSSYGVIRGLHAQRGEAAQAKLVSVIQGSVLDVVVDNRKEAKTFGQTFSIVLNDKDKKQLFVPRGMLHGFAVLSPTAKFIYKCDNFYNKSTEIGAYYKDPELGIDWQIPPEDQIISEKDQQLPFFKSLHS